MHAELAGRADRVAPERHRRPVERNGDSRLRALLLEDAASDEAAVEVEVMRGCGTVEVRVAGPAAAFTLRFDPAEAYPDAVRCAVRATIAQYRSALGLGARGADQE